MLDNGFMKLTLCETPFETSQNSRRKETDLKQTILLRGGPLNARKMRVPVGCVNFRFKEQGYYEPFDDESSEDWGYQGEEKKNPNG